MSAVAAATSLPSDSLTVSLGSLMAPAESRSAMTVQAVRRPTLSLAAAAKPWKDVPFPILFVLGTLFGVVFAMTVVSLSKPKQVAAVAPMQAAMQVQAPVVAAPSRIESAPFVAWAAPPAMPTVSAEPQLPAAPPATAPVHAAHAKHGARGSRRASR